MKHVFFFIRILASHDILSKPNTQRPPLVFQIIYILPYIDCKMEEDMEQIISIVAKHTRRLLSNSFSLLLALHFFFICIHLVIVYIAGKYVPYVRNVSVVSILLLSRLTAPDPDETKYDHGEMKKRKTFSKVLYCMAVVLMVWYVWCGGSWGCVRKTETM